LKRKPQVADVLDDPVVAEIANAHMKTSAQVLLRHLIQLNVVVIPKSVSQSRIRENYEVRAGKCACQLSTCQHLLRFLFLFLG
jgi:diketogulonate reductase-like aldo/keto reductase